MAEELNEKKATGENSATADPVTGAGGPVKNRLADKKKKVPTGNAEKVTKNGVNTPEGGHDYGMKEDQDYEEFDLEEAFQGIFEGSDLSEDFKTKTIAVFESAVNQKVREQRSELEEQFEANLEEQVEQVIDELVEKVDSYLDYVVENWLEENEVNIESTIKVEMAESLLEGIKGLVTEHSIELDDEGVDALAETESRLEETNNKYNEVVEQMMEMKTTIRDLQTAAVFKEVAEGLTETQSDKLSVLSEGVSYKTVEDYRKKVEAIKENYFTESVAPVGDETEYLEEEVEEDADSKILDESVKGYVSALNRMSPAK